MARLAFFGERGRARYKQLRARVEVRQLVDGMYALVCVCSDAKCGHPHKHRSTLPPLPEKVSGLYVITGKDKAVYVGQSADVFKRAHAYSVASRLGCGFYVVHTWAGRTSLRKRLTAEMKLAEALRRGGCEVVSNHGG